MAHAGHALPTWYSELPVSENARAQTLDSARHNDVSQHIVSYARTRHDCKMAPSMNTMNSIAFVVFLLYSLLNERGKTSEHESEEEQARIIMESARRL